MWLRRVIFIIFILSERAARGGGGGGALPDFLFFPCLKLADHEERDWPPCKVVSFGLTTNNALNVRNKNNEKKNRTHVDLTGPHAFGPKKIYFVPKILMKQPHDCSY